MAIAERMWAAAIGRLGRLRDALQHVPDSQQLLAGVCATSTTGRLQSRLARSLNDGTAEGIERTSRFVQLSTIVCAVLRQQHHERSVRLHDWYRVHDPSLELGRSQPPSQGEAAEFCEALHHSLLSAGFRLCSREDEHRSLHGHFGDDQMWNVPVQMSWDDLDGSLVDGAQGGFDAYAAEQHLGRAVRRPDWARKLIVYHRGTGVVEKRGYFFVAKVRHLCL